MALHATSNPVGYSAPVVLVQPAAPLHGPCSLLLSHDPGLQQETQEFPEPQHSRPLTQWILRIHENGALASVGVPVADLAYNILARD